MNRIKPQATAKTREEKLAEIDAAYDPRIATQEQEAENAQFAADEEAERLRVLQEEKQTEIDRWNQYYDSDEYVEQNKNDEPNPVPDPGDPEPEIEVTPLDLIFGQVDVGSKSEQVLNISNATGRRKLKLKAMNSDKPDFQVQGFRKNFIVEPGQSQDFLITFTPSSPGTQNGTLTIDSNDPDEAQILVTMTGKGKQAGQIDGDKL